MAKKPKAASQEQTHTLRDMAALLERCGIRLSEPQLSQLWSYHKLLRRYNPQLNLTRIHNFANMVLKLYADAILPGKLLDLPSPLLDLGTGPGMPGILLKIAFPHFQVLLAESRKNRVEFLRTALETLNLTDVSLIDRTITPAFQTPVAGVITRAVEHIETTLDRVQGCLSAGGLALFMKGPACDTEITAAVERFRGEYSLVQDIPYQIPHTPHARRLVVFRHDGPAAWEKKALSMTRHSFRSVESEQNSVYKDLKKLLTGRGIRKHQKALVSGSKIVKEALESAPDQCEAWITGDDQPPPSNAPDHVAWYRLSSALFKGLDVFGTAAPLLLVSVPPMPVWTPDDGFLNGCSLLLPFQDPENVGSVIRSATAFGVNRIILLAESAHPYHPKSLRASGGAALCAPLLQGPSLKDLPEGLPILSLSPKGSDIARFAFPASFGLLPGVEGPGLPDHLRPQALSIPIRPEVESLNAATATAIALYLWSRSLYKNP